ncbi:MAG: hypothetical protein QM757_32700 [Paludibaculum sp.]
MTALERFRSYLEAVEKRLRGKPWPAAARCWHCWHWPPPLVFPTSRTALRSPTTSLFFTRLTLFLAVALGLAFWLVVPPAAPEPA